MKMRIFGCEKMHKHWWGTQNARERNVRTQGCRDYSHKPEVDRRRKRDNSNFPIQQENP
jgi:hypothetical protein